jgi:hypothetical protein
MENLEVGVRNPGIIWNTQAHVNVLTFRPAQVQLEPVPRRYGEVVFFLVNALTGIGVSVHIIFLEWNTYSKEWNAYSIALNTYDTYGK